MGYSYRGQINLDPTYVATPGTSQSATLEVGDLNGDGHLDLLVLGWDFPFNGSAMPPNPVRPGRVFLGDGLGGFSPAPASLFPVDELLTVDPRKVLWADFNGDGRSDVFVADTGWDGPPFPGQQNLLFLSTPAGGWRSATATLPQVSDFSHTAAAADIDRDGDVDVFVGNGYNNSGAPATAPYLLINDGQGRFTRNDADLPVAPGQALYIFPAGDGAVHFAGAAFSDLDHDDWPDLVVTAEAAGSFDKFRQTTIFWNQGGRFDGTNVTRLAEPDGLPSHSDLDANFADFDGDGVTDIVLIGTNGNPSYDGGYVQVFRGLGQRQFLDVSAQVLPADGHVGAVDGVRTGKPWPMWVRVGDFNGDMGPDFWVQYNGGLVRQDTPVVWINDGTGNFSVIKASFFVEPGQEWQFGRGLLAPSSTGFQNYTVQSYPGSGGLLLTGRTTSTPYFGRPDDAGAEVLVGTAGTNWFVGGRGNDAIDGGAGLDWATYEGRGSRYAVSRLGSSAQWTVSDKTGAEGVDTLVAMEKLRFADKTFDLVNLPRQGVPAYGQQNGFLFDAVFYLLDNPELVPTQTLATALQHYFSTGAAQGKQPNSWFDPTYYENRWPDLTAGNFDDATLFMHYNLYGVWEGRSAGPKFDQFDGNRYLKDNPDVAAYVDAYVADFLGSRTNGAIAHYVIYGQHEQRLAYDLVGQQIDLGYTVDLGG